MAESKLTINITGKDSGASSALRQIASEIDKTQKGIQGFIAKAGAMAQPIAAVMYVAKEAVGVVKSLTASANELMQTYATQERAETALQHTIKATGNAAGVSANELMNLASAFQSVTVYGDEAIIQMQQLFVATKNISDDVMPRAIEAALDMATVLGTDVTASASKLARVLADPAKNLDALKEANIQLTESEKEQISTLQEQNKIAEAQSVILSKIESSYGGIAREIGSLDTSKLTQISNVWGDIKEGLGEGLINALSPALDWILETLGKINTWIQEVNYNRDYGKEARGYLSDARGSAALVGNMSNDMLAAIVKESRYEELVTGYMKNMGVGWDQALKWYNGTAVTAGVHDYDNVLVLLEAVWAEQERRANKARTGSTVSVSAPTSPAASTSLSAVEQFIQSNRSGSTLAMMDYYDSLISEAMKLIGDGTSDQDKMLREIIRGLDDKRKGLTASPVASNPLGDFLGANSSLSVSMQSEAIYSQLLEAQNLYTSATDEEKVILDEIIESLTAELYILNEVYDVSESTTSVIDKQAEGLKELNDNMQLWGNEFINLSSSITNLITSILETQIEETEAMLDSTMDKWDEYFEELDSKQAIESDSLGRMFSAGAISLEEYQQGLSNLAQQREADAIKAQEEEEALQKKKNELSERAFNANKANSIAAATINASQAITKIWAEYASNPVVAGILTGTALASTGMELAAISAQKYTPMAAGGITTGPTKALIGEGGYREAVIPLTPENLERSGLGKKEGVININISVGTAYNSEQLAEDIYHAIERSQRTGALPNWRIA